MPVRIHDLNISSSDEIFKTVIYLFKCHVLFDLVLNEAHQVLFLLYRISIEAPTSWRGLKSAILLNNFVIIDKWFLFRPSSFPAFFCVWPFPLVANFDLWLKWSVIMLYFTNDSDVRVRHVTLDTDILFFNNVFRFDHEFKRMWSILREVEAGLARMRS